MIIKVDCREKKLLKCMEKYQTEDVKVEKKPLELGEKEGEKEGRAKCLLAAAVPKRVI